MASSSPQQHTEVGSSSNLAQFRNSGIISMNMGDIICNIYDHETVNAAAASVSPGPVDPSQACIVETDSQVMQVEEEHIEPLREQSGTQQPPSFGQCGKNGEPLEHMVTTSILQGACLPDLDPDLKGYLPIVVVVVVLWQQILIDNLVGYDTIPTNSLVISPGHGYLYNFEMKELYGLSYRHETPEGPTRFGEGMLTPLDPNPLFTPNLSHLEHLLFLRFISNLHRFKC
ncbi:hypothetical protein ZEAMMB73_Zm00001d007513 [Zea mays]|uniref:Uncharacterized protein n=1 Tax=Zea mays TaxID=4577 RepID=A0A1D6F6Z7_MAIZE|nr:hypothetical protein ZEAMMB73_Zm00001d007513 [Zea mays]